MTSKFLIEVKSLFTNIPYNLVLNAVQKIWQKIKLHTELPFEFFSKILKFCLSIAYCSCHDKFYKQICGVLVGSPISVAVADLGMEELESEVLNRFLPQEQ